MSTAVENTSKSAQLRIDITGQPGSGGSTLGNNLEYVLGKDRVQKVSGGVIRRAAAYYWHEYKNTQPAHAVNGDTAEFLTWRAFEQHCSDVYTSGGYAVFMQLLEPYFQMIPSNHVLNAFNTAHELHSHDPFFDRITDEYQLEHIENTTSHYILESKLAVALRHIRELTSHLQHNRVFSLPLIRIYLTIDADVSATRISQREQAAVTAAEVLERRRNDWSRYSSYYHLDSNDQSLSEEAAMANSYVLDTTNLSREEVLTDVLIYILIQLNQVAATEPEATQPWIELLTSTLKLPEISLKS